MNDKDIENKKNKIANHAKREEKTAFERKRKKLAKVIDEKLVPLQEQEREIILQKVPIVDEIEKIRSQMIETCIHPLDHLVYDDDDQIFICKFCEARINVN